MEKSLKDNLNTIVRSKCLAWANFYAATSLNWNFGKPKKSKYLKEYIDDSDINWDKENGESKGKLFISIFSDLLLEDLLDDERDGFDFISVFFDEIFDCFISESDKDALNFVDGVFEAYAELKSGNTAIVEEIRQESELKNKQIKLINKGTIADYVNVDVDDAMEMQQEIEEEKKKKKELGNFFEYLVIFRNRKEKAKRNQSR